MRMRKKLLHVDTMKKAVSIAVLIVLSCVAEEACTKSRRDESDQGQPPYRPRSNVTWTECQPGTYSELELASNSSDECRPCLRELFSNDTAATSCRNCSEIDPTTWGNSPLNGSTSCVPLEQVYLSPTNWLFICDLILLIMCVIIHSIAIMASIYFRLTDAFADFSKYTFVQVLLLSSVFLYFGLILTHLLPPAMLTCLLRRIGTWLCQTFLFLVLMNKAVHIQFLFKEKSPRKTAVWKKFSLHIALGLLPQIVMLIVSLVLSSPFPGILMELIEESENQFPKLSIQCEEGPFFLHVICIALLLLISMSTSFQSDSNDLKGSFHKDGQIKEPVKEEIELTLFVATEMVLAYVTANIKLVFLGRYPAFGDGVVAFCYIVIAYTTVGWIFGPKLLYLYLQEYNINIDNAAEDDSTCHLPNKIKLPSRNKAKKPKKRGRYTKEEESLGRKIWQHYLDSHAKANRSRQGPEHLAAVAEHESEKTVENTSSKFPIEGKASVQFPGSFHKSDSIIA